MRRSLSQWLEFIGGVHPRSIDLGLDRVRAVAQRLAVLPPAPRNMIIAGTNGKGSTSIYSEALLRAAGMRVGTTLSPHLHRFNERIRVDGAPVDDATIVAAFETVEAARHDATLTYFEYAILAALVVFKSQRVDVCVLEVGLGGRLDAVNLVDADVSVITSIGLDHQEYLGNDIESIAAEKAGVMRAGAPCVFGETRVPAAIVARAQALGTALLVAGRDFDMSVHGESWTFRTLDAGIVRHCAAGLAPARVAPSNAAAAIQAVRLLRPEADDLAVLCDGARLACLAGRFERHAYRERELILDVAHNPHGADFLARQVRALSPSKLTVAIMGCLKEKDAAGIVAALQPVVSRWLFVDTGTPRGQTGAQTMAKSVVQSNATVAGEIGSALDAAVDCTSKGDRILVLGSFDIVEQASKSLELAV